MKAGARQKETNTREQRRARQRDANIGRAAKMHAACLDASSLFDACASAGTSLPALNIGCSGWFYWDWKDCFYPPQIAASQWFDYYAREFSTVELNAPFYSWPTISTVKSWVRQATRKPFIYTVKVCELITHVKRFEGTQTLVRDFGHIGDLLGPQMGCFLFQLPPDFKYTAPRLRRIVAQLDSRSRNVVEFRHSSWWNSEVYKAFADANIIFCTTSAPRLPEELIKTSDEIYVRFHGTSRWYRHNYSSEELAVWAGRIVQSKAKRAWVYFNNAYECNAVRNARELALQLATASRSV